MKKLIHLFASVLLCATAVPICAQEKPPEKPKAEEHARPPVPIKVQIIFAEFDGDKKIASMPYSFNTIADERPGGSYSASLRTGIRVPIEVDGKDAKTTYNDVGSNIDCGIRSEEDGRFRIYLIIDRSALYPNRSLEGERLVSQPNGQPLIRQFRVSESLILKDGQSSDSIVSTDPLNGHTLRVSVTINVLK